MYIRLMTPDDYDAVYALWDGTPGVGLNSIDDARDGIRKYIARNPATCFVAIDEDVIVGTILAGHDGRRGMIYHMTVIPESRRQGIGKALADAALDGLKKEGITKALLVVMKANESGNKFWEALGFTERNDLVYRNISLV
jgi:ribosomal protein S18 acetylase RimI-like enzyme